MTSWYPTLLFVAFLVIVLMLLFYPVRKKLQQMSEDE